MASQASANSLIWLARKLEESKRDDPIPVGVGLNPSCGGLHGSSRVHAANADNILVGQIGFAHRGPPVLYHHGAPRAKIACGNTWRVKYISPKTGDGISGRTVGYRHKRRHEKRAAPRIMISSCRAHFGGGRAGSCHSTAHSLIRACRFCRVPDYYPDAR